MISKNKTMIQVSLPKDIAETLETLAKQNGTTKSKIITDLVKQFNGDYPDKKIADIVEKYIKGYRGYGEGHYIDFFCEKGDYEILMTSLLIR